MREGVAEQTRASGSGLRARSVVTRRLGHLREGGGAPNPERPSDLSARTRVRARSPQPGARSHVLKEHARGRFHRHEAVIDACRRGQLG